ncbi:hypothetical protein [Paraflavitalea sp. CAU 1676]|uniref:hypothetical protein n=1 Tax=Paraflavitalea sp. CAU 1676 TaxID=3032598 RepID=UPI0023D9E3B1|nr:hypothetical protein [Paraflavitalea sp. CAU 1676]MDF2190584.1 hypothetical protein [Paraflavitalea sp. CAU 1676]
MVYTITTGSSINLLLYSCIAGSILLTPVAYYAIRLIRKRMRLVKSQALLLEEDFIP